MKKGFKITLFTLLGIVLVAIISFIGIYWTRFATISTLKEIVPGSFYIMDFKADYKLDEILSRNIENDQVYVNEALDIMYPLLPIKMKAPPLMCSVFAAKNSKGEHIFGRNFDLNQIHCLLIRTSPENGYRSISCVIPEIIQIKKFPINGTVDKLKLLLAPYAITEGINEKGLGVAALVVNGKPAYQKTGKPPITTNLALRLMLDKAATTDEAVNLLKQYDMRASGGENYHFFITDSSGKSVVVEYYNNEMTIENSNICTNFFLRKDAPKSTSKNRCYERFDIVKNALKNSGGIVDEKIAMDILKQAKLKYVNDGKLITTQWSQVFNLEKGTLNICIDMDFDHVYKFSIENFDLNE